MKRGARQRAWLCEQAAGYGKPGVLYENFLVFAPTRKAAERAHRQGHREFDVFRAPMFDALFDCDDDERQRALWENCYRVHCGGRGCIRDHASTSKELHPAGFWRDGAAYCSERAYNARNAFWERFSGARRGYEFAVAERFPGLVIKDASYGDAPSWVCGHIPHVMAADRAFRFEPQTGTAYWEDDGESWSQAQVREALDSVGCQGVKLEQWDVRTHSGWAAYWLARESSTT